MWLRKGMKGLESLWRRRSRRRRRGGNRRSRRISCYSRDRRRQGG